MLTVVVYILLGIIAIAGLVLTVLDLPGIWLIYLSTLILAWITGFEVITIPVLVILFFISFLSTFIDNIVVALGAKRMGGSKWGMLGAVLGGIVGLMIGNVIGLLLGPLIGATSFELVFAHKNFNESLKAGIGSFIGLLLSIVLKLAINVGIIVYVLSRVI
jgi:uncharacterized protein